MIVIIAVAFSSKGFSGRILGSKRTSRCYLRDYYSAKLFGNGPVDGLRDRRDSAKGSAKP